MLQAVKQILLTNWGSQNYSQVLVFTDCGTGFGFTSLKTTIANIRQSKLKKDVAPDSYCLPFTSASKLSFICLDTKTNEPYQQQALKLYQELLDVTGQKGQLFVPKQFTGVGGSAITAAAAAAASSGEDDDGARSSKSFDNDSDAAADHSNHPNKEAPNVIHQYMDSLHEMIGKMCETNYKQFEAVLKCGGYAKLESPIIIWPPPLPYVNKETETTKIISRKLEICGFLNLADIGSPMCVSRHLILPKSEPSTDKSFLLSKSDTALTGGGTTSAASSGASNEYEKLESEIKTFYSKNDGTTADDEAAAAAITHESMKESVCVLLHGALKVENMAALVLLNNDWYGFIYSYADSKKKSNLMLTVLPPGHDNIPWLGDLRYIGNVEDLLPGENASFPVKPEKRSYSQNCVVWIKQAGLQSDIQKVLRHAKKLPEKTQNFYKELNRIRRAALSLGFVELLDGLSALFEREIALLASNASPDCAIQLKHSAVELRKVNNRDLKTVITPLPNKYNQL